MSESHISLMSDAELDVVGGGTSINVVGAFLAIQTNIAAQTSFNILSAGSGNQIVVQSNSASVG